MAMTDRWADKPKKKAKTKIIGRENAPLPPPPVAPPLIESSLKNYYTLLEKKGSFTVPQLEPLKVL